jgi:uncharacterized protein (TIGR02996 family)
MVEHSAFLADILAHPDEDAPRLIYADWLSEQDDPECRARAEFIRVQFHLRELPAHDPAWLEWHKREHSLERLARKRWMPAFPHNSDRVATQPRFKRGFVERIEITHLEMERHGAAIFQAAPVRDLVLHDDNTREGAGEVFRLRGLRQVRSLDIAQLRFRNNDGFRNLVECPFLSGLQALRLGGEQLLRLRQAGATFLAGLRHLSLITPFTPWANPGGGEGPSMDFLPRSLERLRLEIALFNKGLDRLGGELSELPRLGSLRLLSYSLKPHAAWELPLDACIKALRCLELMQVRLDERATTRLAESALLDNVEALTMAGGNLDDQGVWTLLASNRLGRLVALDLAGNLIGADGAQALAHLAPPRLRFCDLRENHLSDSGVRALAEGTGLSQLTGLCLAGNDLTAEGIAELAESLPAELALLDLGSNRLGARGVRALVHSPAAAGLVRLALHYAQLGDGGVAALAGCSALANLTFLDLDDNGIGDEGLRALAESPHLGKLTALCLAGNAITHAGLAAFAESPLFARLELLDVAGNPVQEQELRSLQSRFAGVLCS